MTDLPPCPHRQFHPNGCPPTDPRAARGIPQRLSDPQATASVHWTDPRAALTEIMHWPTGAGADAVIANLAERGVLLVTEAGLRQAIESWPFSRDSDAGHIARWMFAALSGEATE